MAQELIVRNLGIQDYQKVWQEMLAFTDNRTEQTRDEIWFVQHPPVFTQGQTGKPEHLLQASHIPVVQSDRGGQITYHGIGQQIMYILLDLKRLKQQGKEISVRELVRVLEDTVIATLQDYDIQSYGKSDAPGVYVEHKKICSLGLRIRKGCTFHGLALNVNMDLSPFQQINPCGYVGLEMCQLADFVDTNKIKFEEVTHKLITYFSMKLGYTATKF